VPSLHGGNNTARSAPIRPDARPGDHDAVRRTLADDDDPAAGEARVEDDQARLEAALDDHRPAGEEMTMAEVPVDEEISMDEELTVKEDPAIREEGTLGEEGMAW